MATATRARPKATVKPKATGDDGGFITVKVAPLPGIPKEIVLKKSAATLEQALRAFGLHTDAAQDVRVNNKPVDVNDRVELKEGAFVTIVGMVNGGSL